MAVIELTGGSSIRITRSRADGSTVGFSAGGMQFKTLDTKELLDALTWVTATDEQLIQSGMPREDVKVKRPKRLTKKQREERDKFIESPF